MAYTKTTWLDRIVQFPRRFTKSGETSEEVTLEASPGTVTEEGTPVNAAKMNKIEQGIADATDIAEAALPLDGSKQMTGDVTFDKAVALMENIGNLMLVSGKENAYLCSNAYFDGTNWQRYDTSAKAVLINPKTATGKLEFRYADAGANPITWTTYEVRHDGNLSDIMRKVSIPSSHDLNDFKELNAFFPWDTGSGNILNTPYGTYAAMSAKVMVVKNYGWSTGRIIQEFQKIYPTSEASYKWYRIYNTDSGGWQSWIRYIDSGGGTLNGDLAFSQTNMTLKKSDNAGRSILAGGTSDAISNGSMVMVSGKDSSDGGNVTLYPVAGKTVQAYKGGSLQEMWDKSMLRWNNGKLEYNDGGTWTPVGVQAATGSGTTDGSGVLTVGGLLFAPDTVIVRTSTLSYPTFRVYQIQDLGNIGFADDEKTYHAYSYNTDTEAVSSPYVTKVATGIVKNSSGFTCSNLLSSQSYSWMAIGEIPE